MTAADTSREAVERLAGEAERIPGTLPQWDVGQPDWLIRAHWLLPSLAATLRALLARAEKAEAALAAAVLAEREAIVNKAREMALGLGCTCDAEEGLNLLADTLLREARGETTQ